MSKNTQTLLFWAVALAGLYYAWRMYQARKETA